MKKSNWINGNLSYLKEYTLDYGDLEDTDFKIDVVSGLRATTVRVKIYAQGK
jgi:hypothetical protein